MPDAVNVRGQLDSLKTELKKEIDKFANRRKRDKRKGFWLKVSTVILSGAITILLGLRDLTTDAQAVLANFALAFGALVTVLAAIDAFFAHRGLWLLRTKTVRRLEDLGRDVAFYESGLTGEPQTDEVKKFYERLGSILQEDLEGWQKLRDEDGR